jgi:hypothetical protein
MNRRGTSLLNEGFLLGDIKQHTMSTNCITLDEQILIKLSQAFHNICRDAIEGYYNDDFFLDDQDGKKRLCTILMNLHGEFAKTLHQKGATWKILERPLKFRLSRRTLPRL